MRTILCIICATVFLTSCNPGRKEIALVLPEAAGEIEKLAANELHLFLSSIYPEHSITLKPASDKGQVSITIGMLEHLNLSDDLKKETPEHPEGYLILETNNNSLLITSKGERGVLYGVYHLLEKLGCRFLLDTEYIPERVKAPDFNGWEIKNEPLVKDRYANPWEVYLEGCSSWNLEKWRQYINHIQRMGYNSLLVHAYGNDPMFTFDFNGKTKPVGHLTSSVKGRGWGQKHVNDVRRMPGGEKVFTGPAFGSERAIVPDAERVLRSQEFMGEVFRHAAQRGVRVNFALDFDILSNIPQELVMTIPEADRYRVSFDGIDWMGEKGGSYWIPRPDTPEGYRYYKTQVVQVLNLYPEISSYTLWRRRQKSIYCEIQYDELPTPWKMEYSKFIQEHPGSGELPQSAATFAQRKLFQTYRKIFDELGREEIRLATGSWHLYNDLGLFETLEVFIPKEMQIIILDSEITRSEINLQNREWINRLSSILTKDRYVPIIWAHHDDGEYVGSPFPEFKNYHNLLSELKSNGFGVIHWINRPLDLFLLNHNRQVWKNSRNESALGTCQFLSDGIWFDDENTAEHMGRYLFDFWQDFPPMSRANSAYVFDRPLSDYGSPDSILGAIDKRISFLHEIRTKDFSRRQKEFHQYCLDYEKFLKTFIDNQLMYESMKELMEREQWDKARHMASSCSPEKVMEQLAAMASESFVTNGDMGLLFSLGVRWLPHFINLKQGLGMEPVLFNFQHTQHEPLAQMPGKDTYFIDARGAYWQVLGEEETGKSIVETNSKTYLHQEVFENGILLSNNLTLSLHTLGESQSLLPGKYSIELMFSSSGNTGMVQVNVGSENIFLSVTGPTVKTFKFNLLERSIPEITFTPLSGRPVLCGIILKPSGLLPELPEGVEVIYPDSNPLREALEPLPSEAMFKMEGYELWDPSLIKVGDTYHLFCSRWPTEPENDALPAWFSSHVIRATSKSLFGPYEFREVVMHPSEHPWATQGIHNPKVIRAGDKYLLYHLGIPAWETGFAYAENIEGSWEPVPHPVIPTNNPALLIREDGSAYAVGKFKPKPHKDGRWDALMDAYEADHYEGPYRQVKDSLSRLPADFELEDPTIWWANDQYNVVCTDWEAKVTGIQKSVVYYVSKDGISYQLYSQIPVWSQYDPIPLEDGGELMVGKVERPQVFLNEKGEVVALLAGVESAEEGNNYVVIRPVNNFIP